MDDVQPSKSYKDRFLRAHVEDNYDTPEGCHATAPENCKKSNLPCAAHTAERGCCRRPARQENGIERLPRPLGYLGLLQVRSWPLSRIDKQLFSVSKFMLSGLRYCVCPRKVDSGLSTVIGDSLRNDMRFRRPQIWIGFNLRLPLCNGSALLTP